MYLFNRQYKIFISGSNSNLISSELSTHFRGRIFEYKVFSLNLKEILNFKGIKQSQHYSIYQKAKIKNIFYNILLYGNFPEIVLAENDIFKLNILKDYLDILTYKDLIERYKIKNEIAIRLLIEHLAIGNSKSININKFFNTIKSQNIKISKNTLYNYYQYLKNVFYIQEIKIFFKPKNNGKTYLYNIGTSKLFLGNNNLGQNFENFIFLELKKKFEDIYYKSNGGEVDLFIPNKNLNIQITYNLNKNNLEKEINYLSSQNGKKFLVYFEKDYDPKEFNFKDIEIMDFIDFLNSIN